jgi:hypothetical protein
VRERENILISRLDHRVLAGPVGAQPAPGCWRAVPYKADGFDGVFLCCGEATDPAPVTLRLDARGPHRIRLGVYGAGWGGSIRVRLTDDLCFRTFTTPPHDVIAPPVIHELLWKECDLTGRNLVLAGAYDGRPLPGALAFVRLEPIPAVSPPPAPDPWRPMAVSNDGHCVFRNMPLRRREDLLESLEAIPDESCMRILLWGNGDGDVCNYPTAVGTPLFRGDLKDPYKREVAEFAVPNMRLWREEKWDSLQTVRSYAARRGWEFHVYIRMEAFADAYPHDTEIASDFFYAHPQWWCLDREGNPLNRLSYAFPEVQDHMLELMREMLSYGVDGVCLCLIRGIPVMLYEAVMVEGFKARFGEDPRLLDERDERWLGHQAGVFTGFVRRAKELLGESRRLSVMVPGNEADLRRWGLDVASWVREGLVDDVYPVGQKFNAANTHYDAPEALDYDYFQSLEGRAGIRLIPCFYTWTMYHSDVEGFRALIRSLLDKGADGYCIWDGYSQQIGPGGNDRIDDIGRKDWGGPEYAARQQQCRLVNLLELNGFRIHYYGTHEVD